MTDRSELTPATVLLVEDDEQVVHDLTPHLRAYGFQTEHESRGDSAVGRILSMQPDAVLLDLGLPGKDGSEVCRAVRGGYRGVIIALTRHADPLDHILALECGADDFLAKPVEPPILLAHLKAALRRAQNTAGARKPGAVLEFGALTIDLHSRSVKLRGEEVAMTSAEFDLLWLLASRAGNVVSRGDIRAELRGLNDDLIDRSVDMRVSRLRKLLGDDGQRPRRIKTIRGKGYLFSPAGWD